MRTTVLIVYISVWCTTQTIVLSMLKKSLINLVFVAVDWFSGLPTSFSKATTKPSKTTANSDHHVLCWTTTSKHAYYTADLKMTTEGNRKWQAFRSLKRLKDKKLTSCFVACRLKGSLAARGHGVTWVACTLTVKTSNSALLSGRETAFQRGAQLRRMNPRTNS